jgi:hypothetical protein
MINYPFDTPIADLKKGQRFYHAGMWYDFVSVDTTAGYAKMTVSNGYDDRVFTIIARPADKVAISKSK